MEHKVIVSLMIKIDLDLMKCYNISVAAWKSNRISKPQFYL